MDWALDQACLCVASIGRKHCAELTPEAAPLPAPVVQPASAIRAPRGPLFRPGAAQSLRMAESKDALVQDSWQIYVALGDKGLRYSALYASQPRSVHDAFLRGLARFEESSIRQHRAVWRRWCKFADSFMPLSEIHWQPALECTNAFLQDQCAHGPSVAKSLFQDLASYWRTLRAA